MKAPCILVVDDTPASALMAQAILEAEGFQTLVAHDGPHARELARNGQPELILLDVIMPGEQGFETCALLKSDPRTADIPVIFLSALDGVADKVNGLKIGGVDYVSKPVHGEELLARVRAHLRIRESSRLMAEQQRQQIEQLRQAQQAILVRPEHLPEAAFAVHYQPLEEAGGDFYDVVEIDSGVYGYFVADLSGHGAGAAFLTSAIKALLRQYAGPVYSPEDSMRGIDAVMRQMLGDEQYLTACYARLNRRTWQLSLVSAGHPPALLVRAGGTVEVVETDSQPLGTFSSVVLHRRDLALAPGDRFFLYTDGLIETRPFPSRRVGLAALARACERHGSAPLELAAARIVEQIVSDGAAFADDALLLGVEMRT